MTEVSGRTFCAACGVVAPRHGSACAACAAPLVRTPSAASGAPPHDVYWVAVRCAVPCRACSFLAPVDHLALEGSIDCVQCGVRQRLDAGSWTDALAFAQAVGDLAGPDPEGRTSHPGIFLGQDNPHKDIGINGTFGALRQTGTHVIDGAPVPRSLQIEAAPGQPMCRTCHVPLAARVTSPGQVETTCPTCQTHALYALPPGVAAILGGTELLGVLSDEHRTDRPRAQESSAGDARALSCPSCGGPLKLAPHDRLALCEFCRTTCVIPAHALVRNGEVPKPAVWWHLYSGSSAARRALLTETGEKRHGGGMLPSVFGPSALKTAPIGSTPGVYEAPASPGLKLEQVLFTLVLAFVSLGIGYVVTGR